MVAPKVTEPPKEDAKKTTDGSPSKNKKEEVSKRALNNQCSVHMPIHVPLNSNESSEVPPITKKTLITYKKNAPPSLLQKEEELSEEDQQLKENLELMVERAQDPDPGVQKLAIESVANEIRSATSSMTSVPKPLKFLHPHYATLKATCDALPQSSPNLPALADVISVLGMTSSIGSERDTLKYKLLGAKEDVSRWGHEYVRHLAAEIGEEYEIRKEEEGQPIDDLMSLVKQIVPYNMTHNAEPEAVDLLLEVDAIDLLQQHVDINNAPRTALYLSGCAAYLPEPEDSAVLRAAYAVYRKVNRWSDALRTALRSGDKELAVETFAACSDKLEKRQLAYIMAAFGLVPNLEEGPTAVEDDDEREKLQSILFNSKLSEHFLALARDLDVMEAKTPEDVYKSHLVDGRAPAGPALDSARANLAATFVNAFVNAGFGQDKLVTAPSSSTGEEGNDVAAAAGGSEAVHWVFKNKDHGKMSAAASLGMVLLWDVEGGLPQIDRFLYATDQNVVAGALLAVGIVNSNVVDEVDPAYAILSEYVEKNEPTTKIGAMLGLGLAYAGREKAEVAEHLLSIINDTDESMEIAGIAAISLGLIYAGSANGEAVETLLQAMMLRSESDLATPNGRLMCLALGLVFLLHRDAVEATIEVAKTLGEQVSRFLQTTLEVCAYAGSGDVLKIQSLLAECGEHIEIGEEAEAWKASHQMVAALGLGLVAMSEELGSQMSHRALEHLLQYGDPATRRGVPLALALLNTSDPDMTVMDTLSRLSHDTDAEVAAASVLAMGITGAGTNNARLAGMLRSLSSYYYREPTLLFLVRIAQGLVHAGKGLMTINPWQSDRLLLPPAGLAGLLVVLFAGMNVKETLASKMHYLLYALTPAMRPRMLMTLDGDDDALLPVTVRVGTGVDTVAQAGKPKTITGFQSHTTPVLLAVGERAELGTEKYIPLSPTLEGIVILKRNPEYVEEQ